MRIGMNVMHAALAAILALPALTCFGQSEDALEEVIVAGRQPGPPLWRISHGDSVLWIFPLPDLVPKKMIWDSSRVERVIGDSQEALSPPDVEVEMSKLMLFNPLNIVRGVRLSNRITRNPNDATLEEVVPPDIYARFSALRNEYFPRYRRIEQMRPLVAGAMMVNLIHDEHDLVAGDDIERQIRRLVRRDREIAQTTIETSLVLEGNFRELAQRLETMVASLSPEQELACFEAQITRMESDLPAARRRANAWALGYISEFRNITLPGSDEDVCTNLMLASSEGETLEDLIARQNTQWLEAAETALATNPSTFATLSLATLLLEDGPIADLKAKGYEVREP